MLCYADGGISRPPLRGLVVISGTGANIAVARELAGWCWSLAVMSD
ncbi:hypothetical protein ACPPVW_00910 [Leifsonia sp. McL0607]